MKMKNTLTTFLLISALSFSSILKAEEVSIPVVSKPSVLQEGTQRELTADQIAELLPWAKNSKVFLEDLLNSIQGLSSVDKIDRLELGIKSVVAESAPKNSELLMRYVLNRALVLNDVLKAEMSEDIVGTSDTKIRVLLSSVKMAIRFYDQDMQVLSKKSVVPFASFGVEYFGFLNELNKSIFDASAGYKIQKTALEWLQWDLYRDLKNTSYAPQIVKINNSLKLLPEKKLTDVQSLTYIRQMKLTASQLSFSDIQVTSTKVKVKEEVKPVRTSSTRSKNIKECQGALGSTSGVSTCINYSNIFYIAPEVVQYCGFTLGSESGKLACILTFKDRESDSELLAGIEACGNAFGSENGKTSCLNFSITIPSDSFEKNVNACGVSFGSESGKLNCVERSLKYKIDNSLITACGSSLGSESGKLECVGLMKNQFSGDDANGVTIIKNCGKAMGSESAKISCISKVLNASLPIETIEDCAGLNTDSARLQCMNP
jgi:hypothetical protein